MLHEWIAAKGVSERWNRTLSYRVQGVGCCHDCRDTPDLIKLTKPKVFTQLLTAP